MPLSANTNFSEEYNNQLPTLGKVISDVLGFFGGSRLYGVGGDFAANLITALEKQIEICPSSNEMHAGFSACAQAEIDGLGICLTTYMVGSLPCTSAAALAMTESLPVIFISGAPAETEVNNLAIHHTIHPNSSWKAEYDNALEAFAALGLRVERLQGQRVEGQPNIAGERFYQIVAEAFKTKQPVFIEIPRDQVFAKTQPLKLPSSPESICCGSNVIAGNEQVVKIIVDKLQKSTHPVMFLGDRLKHNKVLKKLVIEFSDKFNIPYATTWFAKGLFDEFSPMCLGAYNGVFTQTAGREYIENTMDYVIDVATSIFSQDCNVAFGTGTHEVERFKNKTVLKGATLLEQDLIEVFELLLVQDLKPYDYQYCEIREITAKTSPDEPIDFNNLAKVLNELQQADKTPYIYMPEVGNSYFSSYSLKVRNSSLGRGWLTNPWYGAMGTSLPYARVIAQRVKDNGDKDRAIVITGDGGFHFQLNELIHLLKDKTNVTIIYMRNNVFHLGKSSDAKMYYCNDEKFDVHALIKAYQGESATCHNVAEFRHYFKACMQKNTGIRLIEVLASPVESRQCHELKLLNLYIKSQNGFPEAIEQWKHITKK